MAQEIERKFLVETDDWKKELDDGSEIIHQGYISYDPVVRIRIYDVSAVITIKGKKQGISCSEYEYSISKDDAFAMLDELVKKDKILTKRRTYVLSGGKTWEVDEFLTGKMKGKVIAEVELESEDEDFQLPQWLKSATEVSRDPRYFNVNMV